MLVSNIQYKVSGTIKEINTLEELESLSTVGLHLHRNRLGVLVLNNDSAMKQ